MYNRLMQNSAYQIRLCNSCGLRYPLMDGHAFGTRCPICMGETRLILSRELSYEPKRPTRPPGTLSSTRSGGEGWGEEVFTEDGLGIIWNGRHFVRLNLPVKR